MDKELKEQAHRLDILIRIGKNGITNNVIKEIIDQLDRNKLVKIKLLKSFMEENNKKEIISEIAEKTNSKVISAIGFVVVLWKR